MDSGNRTTHLHILNVMAAAYAVGDVITIRSDEATGDFEVKVIDQRSMYVEPVELADLKAAAASKFDPQWYRNRRDEWKRNQRRAQR